VQRTNDPGKRGNDHFPFSTTAHHIRVASVGTIRSDVSSGPNRSHHVFDNLNITCVSLIRFAKGKITRRLRKTTSSS